MLLSMTGFGDARADGPGCAVSVEVRSVNNRHLKVNVRGTEPYPLLEPDVEKVVRRHLKRGTVHVQVRVERESAATGLAINAAALRGYVEQIEQVARAMNAERLLPSLLAGVLELPGVAPESGSRSSPPEDEWPAVEKALETALGKLNAVRKDEGRAMATELMHQHRHVKDQLAVIREHLPRVTDDFRTRILDRVKQAVANAGVDVQPEHLVREVAAYADRTDVSEELVRLDAHLVQFEQIVRDESDGPGRRLEFVLQEMGRETNTLGSKAGDVTITRHVVEIKATLEKVRELALNVE